jgi:hypothetical protein
LGDVCGLLRNLNPGASASNPMLDAMKNNAFLRVWTPISTVIAVGLHILLLTASIKALSLQSWARKALLAYGIIAIVLATAGVLILVAVLLPLLSGMLNSSDRAQRMGANIAIGAGIAGIILGYLYPVFLVIYMRKPHVVQAFEGGPAAA